ASTLLTFVSPGRRVLFEVYNVSIHYRKQQPLVHVKLSVLKASSEVCQERCVAHTLLLNHFGYEFARFQVVRKRKPFIPCFINASRFASLVTAFLNDIHAFPGVLNK